ncbi:MAG: 4-coumarate--CoA ligase [Pseudomonadota bacterium]
MPPSRSAPLATGQLKAAGALRPDACLRLLTHVGAHSLRNMGRKGQVDPAAANRLTGPGLSQAELRALKINEAGLGLDSLARLDLAMDVSRFFEMDRTGADDYLTVRRTVGDWADLAAEHLRLAGDDAALVFATSGSTGPPKHLRHTLLSLRAEMHAFLALPQIAAAPPHRIVSLVPAHHIYGALYSVILPDVTGAESLDLWGRPASAVARRLKAGDLVIGTPRDWGALASGGFEIPEGVGGVCSSGPSSDGLWREVKESGLETLTEVFGSTETGGLGWRTDGQAPFTLHDHLARSENGVFSVGDGRQLPLQDALKWSGDREFRPEQRLDAAVVVAGVNVSLRNVREVLCACPGVVDAAVRPGASRLKAFVVPASTGDINELEERLRAHASRALEAAARPMHFTFGPALPRNTMGKLTDWPLQEPAGN